jgi:hypothetical protein
MQTVHYLLVVGLLSYGSLGVAAPGASRPAYHVIDTVPWHVQMNGLFCGDGSLESVFDYWGPDIDQKAIANVARSSSIGTWAFDIRRAGHFSVLSTAQGGYFPNEVPTAGFAERPLGYAAFAHSAPTPWLEELKSLLAADLPVILLMTYAPDGTGGGHYRVAIGYDDVRRLIYFVDPWGRDLRYLPGTEGWIAWTEAEVTAAWNYAEYGTPQPFHGVAIFPWSVDVTARGKTRAGETLTVSATVTYPCPTPFDPAHYPASNSTATITVPAGMTLLDPATRPLGTLAAGESATVSWKVRIDTSLPGPEILVEARGVVSGSVPEARWTGQSQVYPPYDYTDVIGGRGGWAW